MVISTILFAASDTISLQWQVEDAEVDQNVDWLLVVFVGIFFRIFPWYGELYCFRLFIWSGDALVGYSRV